MAISIAQQVDLLYKQAFGVTKTDTANNKSPSNESIPSPLLIRGDTQWVQSDQIPAVAAAVTNIVQAYTGSNAVQMAADTTTVPVSGVYPTWLTNLTYWIPQEFGSTYNIKIYVDNPGAADPTSTGTQIFAAGSGGTGEYYYNYQSGVLNFIGQTIPAALTSGKVLYAVGYRYIGLIGVQNLPSGGNLGNLSITDTTISTTTLNSNLIFAPNGTGQVTTTASFTGSNIYANLVTTANLSITEELTGNTANLNSASITDFVASNTANLGNVGNITIIGGSNGQFLQTDGSGVLTWATVSSSKISNGTSNVDIPAADGDVIVSVAGNANVLVISGTGSNITGTLGVSGNTTVNELTINNALNGNTANFTGNLDAANANLGNLVIANHVQTTTIQNGNSNVGIVANGNVTLSVTGSANVVEISNTGVNVVGYVYANGNGTFGALQSNTVTALLGNLQLYSEQANDTYIELKPFGNGTVDVANFRITSLAQPVNATDAATKQYVDEVAEGLRVKPSAYLATTVDLGATYNNGNSGVGATLTATTNVQFPLLDGYQANTTSPFNGILVKNQTNAAENGRYNLTTLGDGSNPWVLTRCGLCDTSAEIPGSYVFVTEGNTYADTGWVMTVANPATFVIGTDAITIIQFSGAGVYTAGQGLTLTGTTFSVNVDNITTEISGGNVIVKANAQFTTPNIDAATGTSLDLTGNVLAANLNANTKITSLDIDVSGNLVTNALTVNTEITGNTANFSGAVIVPNLTVNAELTGNTANFNSATITDFVASNTANLGNVGNITIIGGSNGQFLQTDGSGVLTWATVDSSKIANGTSNVDIPSLNGDVTISASGNANVLVVSGTGANITGTLSVSSNLTVTEELIGNTANFSGNIIVPNLTVNLELVGNTANLNSATVTDFVVSNTANLGNVGNITIIGGSNGQFLQTDGSGVLTWATVDSSKISNGTSNVDIPSTNGDVIISVAGVPNVLVISSSDANLANNLNAAGNVTANSIVSNSNVETTSLYANYIYANNTANILGDVLANANLTVGLELGGNTANFTTSVQTPIIYNGNSNINIATNSDIAIDVAGTSNILVISNVGANITGNLSVTGDFSVGSLTANNLSANSNVTIGDTLITWGTTTTTAITANQTIAQVAVSGFAGVQFLVRGIDSSGSKYSVATVQAVTDGSNVDYVVFGSVGLGGATGTLAVNIDGSNIALQVTPTSSNSTIWTTQYRLV